MPGHRIYLTGGTGYIGRELARRLVEGGHEVRALVRPTSDAEPLRALGVATFPGDLGDRASMREGMSGADWVILALRAPFDFDGLDLFIREVMPKFPAGGPS